jgi:hypothetical protein
LDHQFNIRGEALTVEQRKALVKRVLAKCLDVGPDGGPLIGVALLKELFGRMNKNRIPPFWVLAGLHHQVSLDGRNGVDGNSLQYARLLHSRGSVPVLKDILAMDGKRVPKGCLHLYAELCSIALKGMRSKSPVALKRLVHADPKTDPVSALKSSLGLTSDEQLQTWFKSAFNKAVARRVLTRRETVDALSQSVAALAANSNAKNTVERLRGITTLDPVRAKVFTTEILKLSTKTPPLMRVSIHTLVTTLLKKKDAKRWRGAITECWNQLKAIEVSLATMDERLKVLDMKNRLRLLQKHSVRDSSKQSKFGTAVSKKLDSAELSRKSIR